MDWLIEANKLGKYYGTKKGFRIYITKPGYVDEEFFERDGDKYRSTTFHSNHYTAIDKDGNILQGVGIEDIGTKIIIEDMRKYYARKDAIEAAKNNR